MSNVTGLDYVLNQWATDYARSLPESLTPVSTAGMAALRDRLQERENAQADLLRLAGAQFGMFPQIVAEVLAEVGLGAPVSEEERALIRAQFNDLMEQIQRAQRGEGPMPTP